MATDATKQARSAGARYERRCWLAMARRLVKSVINPYSVQAINKVIRYGETRQKRYDPRVGGLGRK